LLRIEYAQILALSAPVNRRPILPILALPDTLNPEFVVTPRSAICFVLFAIGGPKFQPPIIQRIAMDVIHFSLWPLAGHVEMNHVAEWYFAWAMLGTRKTPIGLTPLAALLDRANPISGLYAAATVNFPKRHSGFWIVFDNFKQPLVREHFVPPCRIRAK